MSTPTIDKRLQILEDLKRELNVLKEQYDDALETDPQYQDYSHKVDELKEETKEKKREIESKVLDKPMYTDLKQQMKEKRQEMKELKEILSLELVEYYKETGETEIEDPTGDTKKMKFSVRLVS